MHILYAVIAEINKSVHILCECGQSNSHVKTILTKLSETPQRSFRQFYAQDDFLFHVRQVQHIVYLCITDKNCKLRIPSAFLDDIETLSQSNFSNSILKERMTFHNENDKITQMQDKIESVKGMMIQNIDDCIERGLDELQGNSHELDEKQNEFRKKTKKKRLLCSIL